MVLVLRQPTQHAVDHVGVVEEIEMVLTSDHNDVPRFEMASSGAAPGPHYQIANSRTYRMGRIRRDNGRHEVVINARRQRTIDDRIP